MRDDYCRLIGANQVKHTHSMPPRRQQVVTPLWQLRCTLTLCSCMCVCVLQHGSGTQKPLSKANRRTLCGNKPAATQTQAQAHRSRPKTSEWLLHLQFALIGHTPTHLKGTLGSQMLPISAFSGGENVYANCVAIIARHRML